MSEEFFEKKKKKAWIEGRLVGEMENDWASKAGKVEDLTRQKKEGIRSSYMMKWFVASFHREKMSK